ncbi:putative formin, FH2 domain-containing protein [Helianthus annuus]|uniref:Formin-like protein n=1 Tax=Helianthus annuus TaxID=4232 RepID=A0A251UTV5_HELAN|nr:putative formin, FH2 domain-containing protein [Helianthus annuus]KAJ0924014.1 putative formin, FH2 domain-containing protein [Helianthus annuus]
MALFRRFLHRKRRDRHHENSDWVLGADGCEPPSPPRPPPTPPPSPPMEKDGGPVAGTYSFKPLNWEKVNKALEGSLWEELLIHGQPQRTPPEIDVSELQQLFSNSPPKIANSKEADKRKTSSSMHEKVQLIDKLRANNIEIMLTEVNLPLPLIVEAVFAMDDTVLYVDQIENLLKLFPTKEETEILKSYKGDQDKLGQCEQYFLELMKVPRMESKLNALMFTFQFDSQLAELKNNLNTVNSACDEVRKSVKLKEIMKRILYLGNALNQGTARGAAIGFKLDSLMKLTDIRASDSGLTFMHYLCKLLANKSPDLLDFHEDLVSLEAATKIHLKNVAEQMLAVSCGLKTAKQELDASANDGPVSTGFHLTLNKFISHAEVEVASVTNFFTVVGKSADGLALYFGEDPARCPFEQATQTLFDFVREFQKCHKENLEQDELKRKESEEGDGNVVSPTPPPQPLLAHVENKSMETCSPPLAVRDESTTTSVSPPAPPPAFQSLDEASTIEKAKRDGLVVPSPPQMYEAPQQPPFGGHEPTPAQLPGAPGEHLDL